ncbi:hypothetical protein N4G70_32235 [Streptomyces sp. ASQP_92]|uniref:hypothetical protein n=1 Tax=Streptomyces sp. ASQP_92 TaxID=2979116 RepID=UPI0021BEAAA0|nr:hypothetical protein [Streptomyces sp. ASQP_92]MCT9093503.1 hypothetical protein [Streptomyces sp. ASQP_92]
MHEPESTSGRIPSGKAAPGASEPDDSRYAGDAFEEARAVLRRFIRGCTQQILEERRAARPDAARIEELTAAVKAAKADEKALLADPGQAARITALYTTRLSELGAE